MSRQARRVYLGLRSIGVGRLVAAVRADEDGKPRCDGCGRRVSVSAKSRCFRCENALRPRTARRVEAIRRYQSGESIGTIGKALGISRERVAQYLRPLGIIGTAPRNPRFNCSANPGGPVRVNEKRVWRANMRKFRRLMLARALCRDYQAGMVFAELAEKYGIPIMAAWALVSERMKTRRRGRG